MGREDSDWSAGWVAAVAVLASVAAVIAVRAHLVPIDWWALPVMAAFGVAVSLLVTVMQHNSTGPSTGWFRVYAYRFVAFAAAGSWMTWTVRAGWHQGTVLSLLGGAVALVVLSYFCGTPESVSTASPAEPDDTGRDRRSTTVQQWEARMRQITKQRVAVVRAEPWETPADGMRLYVELPAGEGMTATDLAGFSDRFAAAARLPQGCNVRVLDGDHQGTAVVDIMLRDCLTDEVMADEDTTPASINDDFVVMTTPRGEVLSICLRIFSMIVGGTTGSGKTTLLHRIIMRLARCVDALIWVVDTNGGGVAEPWINAWARGAASRPVVDWVADSEEEAAALVAVASAVIKDRKTNREARLRKTAGNTTVLPVDAKMPAIIVLTDEGGEVRQAASLLGQLAGEGISRLAQIGRAEGGRVIMSVLRGTADLLDKGLRVNAALRICLRMEEEGEYDHVLGANPGRTRLLHTGTGYIRRGGVDSKPVFGRTVNVLLDAMDRHSIACADLRPDLDDRGLLVAARIRPVDIMGGREPDVATKKLQVMCDAAAGLVYANRWERYADKLAEMRGDDPAEVVDDAMQDVKGDIVHQEVAAEQAASQGSGVLDVWAAQVMGPAAPMVEQSSTRSGVDLDDRDAVDAEARRLLGGLETATAAPGTARERILAMVDAAGREGISSGEVEKRSGVTRSRAQDLLKQLREEGAIQYRDPSVPGVYVTPRNARMA